MREKLGRKARSKSGTSPCSMQHAGSTAFTKNQWLLFTHCHCHHIFSILFTGFFLRN